MEYKEQEISLSGLLVYIMRGWRSILLLMVVFALVLGSFRYVTVTASQESEPVEEVIEELSPDRRHDVENTIKNEAKLAALEEYMDKAPLMQANPFDIYIANLSYWVDTGYVIDYAGKTEVDNTKTIIKSYIKALQEEDWRTDALERLGNPMEMPYFTELVSISSEEDVNTITMQIKYDNVDDLNTILECIRTYMEQIYLEKSENFGPHKLTEVNAVIRSYLDHDLSEEQSKKLDTKNSLTVNIEKAKEKFTPEQWAYYNERMGIDEPIEVEEEKKEEQPESPLGAVIKFAVLGAAAGLFILCAGRGMYFLFADKVRSCNGIGTSLKVPSLGYVESAEAEKKKKKMFHKVDEWISSFEKRELASLSQEQQVAIIVSGIALYCEQYGTERVFLSLNRTVSGMDDLGAQVAERLKKKEGISCSVVDDVMQAPKVAQNMKENEGIVFLVKENVSSYAQLAGGVNFCKDHNKRVLGVVVAV